MSNLLYLAGSRGFRGRAIYLEHAWIGNETRRLQKFRAADAGPRGEFSPALTLLTGKTRERAAYGL